MDESNLNTIVKYKAKGNKTFKEYDAIVIEAVKGKYITVEIAGMSTLQLKWDDSAFIYAGDIFGNKLTCTYEHERDFTAKQVTTGSGEPSEVITRKKSGYKNHNRISTT